MLIPKDVEILEKLKKTTLISAKEAFGMFADRSIRQTKNTWLKRIPVASGCHLLFVINYLLCLYNDPDGDSYGLTQATIAANLLPESVRRRFGHPTLQYRPAFGRQQVLSLLKMLLKSGDGDLEQVRNLHPNELHALGKALVNITDFMAPPADNSLEQAITSLAPVMELYNAPPIDVGLAHTFEFLTRLEEVAPGYRVEIEKIFKEGTGLDIGFLLEATGTLYSMFLSPIEEVEKTLANTSTLNWRRSKAFIYLPQFEDNQDAFFNLYSKDLCQLQFMLRQQVESDLRETNDFTIFRQTPILNLDEDIFTCIDIEFLLEKVSFGFFRTLFNALPSDKKNPARKDDLIANRLNTNWGLAIERYVSFLLSSQQHYIPDVNFKLNKSKPEQIDGVGVFDSCAVILETKGRFLSAASKYGMDGRLIDELNQKFGRENSDRDKGAVFQLVRDVKVLFDRQKFPQLDLLDFPLVEELQKAAKIYPVLVVEESLLRFDLIPHLLRLWFDQELKEQGEVESRDVRPLCVLPVEIIERMEPYLEAGIFQFIDFLKYFDEIYVAGAVPARLGASRVLAEFVQKNNFERLSNARVAKIYDDFMNEIIEKLRAGEESVAAQQVS